jgi:hypothetical protein
VVVIEYLTRVVVVSGKGLCDAVSDCRLGGQGRYTCRMQEKGTIGWCGERRRAR